MSKCIGATLIALALASSASASAVLSVEVGYGFGGTSSSGFYSGAPDTGFVVISNTGDADFEGSFSLTGSSGYGAYGHIDVDDHTPAGFTLAAGDYWILLAGPEGSNYGGYNKCQDWIFGDPSSGQDPSGTADSGLLLSIVGSLDGSTSISYSIYDHEIHSGTSALNPFGVTLDNYILQGGDPFGRDTFDTFEVGQAHAFFTVDGDRTAVPVPCEVVPETSSFVAWSLLGTVASLVSYRRWKVPGQES